MKFWIGVILFFGLGVSIGLSVASVMLADGSSVFSAVALGACAGGYVTTFAFFVLLNLTRRFRIVRMGKRQARDS
jgi:hypothetical protein